MPILVQNSAGCMLVVNKVTKKLAYINISVNY